MGWLWSSSSPASKGTSDETATAAPAAPTQSEPKYSDPEIAKFMAQIQSEFGNEPEPERPSRPEQSLPRQAAAAPPPTSDSPWRSLWGPAAQSETEPSPSSGSPHTTNTRAERDAARPQPQPQPRQHPDQLDPISESLLPTTMSCRNALDAAFYCQSPGGQWNAVYREGGVRSCSQHWDDLFFCMRTRPMTGKVKEDAIRDHYRAKELAKYAGKPNSTDVWESRDQKVEPGTAFTARYDAPTLSDEEWWAMEIRRRRAMQEALDAEKRT